MDNGLSKLFISQKIWTIEVNRKYNFYGNVFSQNNWVTDCLDMFSVFLLFNSNKLIKINSIRVFNYFDYKYKFLLHGRYATDKYITLYTYTYISGTRP